MKLSDMINDEEKCEVTKVTSEVVKKPVKD